MIVYKDYSFFDHGKIFSYHKLPIDIIPTSMSIVKGINPTQPDFSRPSHYKLPKELLSDDFVKLLKAAGLGVKHAEIFYRPGVGNNMNAFIHTDTHLIHPGFAKINYVTGGEKNLMKWWRPRIAVTDANRMSTSVGTDYIVFEEKDCDLYDQVDMKGLYVVNAAIPHSVEMTQGSIENPRICISITPCYLNRRDNHSVGCSDAVKRIHDAIKSLRLSTS